MRQLQPRHIELFRILRDHCSFLIRKQIQGVLTLSTNATTKQLRWLMSENYLARRYRADSFKHYQTPVYYLGRAGWKVSGGLLDDYKSYERDVVGAKERGIPHSLAVYDVYLKFILESQVKRIVGSEDRLWQQPIGLSCIPDCWIEFSGGEAFVEVDLDTESREVVANKFENYLRFKDGGFESVFPGRDFRILFITTTEERIASLEEITRCDTIWFATMSEFLKEALNHEHWFAIKGFYALPIAGQKEM